MLTRKFLKELGIDADNVDKIIEAHLDTMNEIKADRDTYKEKAAAYDTEVKNSEKLNREVEKLTKENAELSEALASEKTARSERAKTDKEKFETLENEYNTFKADVEKQRETAAKTEAYKGLLRSAGIAEKRIDSIIKLSGDDIEGLEISDKGVANSEQVTENIKANWGEFIQRDFQAGANTPNPPEKSGAGGFSAMSLADKMRFANENPTAPEVTAWLGNK